MKTLFIAVYDYFVAAWWAFRNVWLKYNKEIVSMGLGLFLLHLIFDAAIFAAGVAVGVAI